jgi:hypothetical protein
MINPKQQLNQILRLDRRISLKIISILTIGISLNLGAAINAKAGGVIGNGSPGSCNDTAISNALNGGGNVIFNCGKSRVVIKINSEKNITANTIIDGRGLVTLDGGKSRRIFSINRGVNLTVKNLAFSNGHTTDQGAAIYSQYKSTLTVTNSQFYNNISKKPGEHGGGAIFSGPLTTLIVDKSRFFNNQGGQGGAIRGLNSNIKVTNSTFTGNKAVDPNLGSGGAIYVDSAVGDYGTIKIANSTFDKNSGTSFGGAFFNSIYNGNQTTIENSKFTGNRVGSGNRGQGGAIWSTGDGVVRGGKFLGVNKSTLVINNSVIAYNQASSQGGGVWLARHPNLVVSNTTISGNVANRSNGGGLVLGDNGYLQLTNSTVTNNQVLGGYALGGGVIIAAGKAKITNTTISHNLAQWQGGGIARTPRVPQANVVLKNTIVANNTARNGGNKWNITNNCFRQLANGGSNLQFPARNTKSSQDVDCVPGIITAEPKLGPLKNNGGVTLTRALLTGSAAVQRGYGCPSTDQRGVRRSTPCDLGAFEAPF